MSDFVFNRTYRGKVKALILDWSGTTADAYVVAPAVVFVEVFKKHGVEISMPEARGPMGLRKDLHIKKLTEEPVIAERWKAVHGSTPGQAEVDAMFADFVPMQLDCLRKYTDLLPGVAEVTQRLQARGIKIGSTTGFVRSMVDVLEAASAKQGYRPDASVAGDEVTHGARPTPHMVYKNLDLMGIHTIQSVVKVDDTVSGIGEAQNAGCWGVGVVRYSNYMDVDTPEQGAALSEAEIEPVIADINARLARGEKP